MRSQTRDRVTETTARATVCSSGEQTSSRTRSTLNGFVRRCAAISYTRAIITFLAPAGSRVLTLSIYAGASDAFSPSAPVHFHLSRPGPIARDLVAVHRSVENESTSCRGPPGGSHLPCPAPVTDTFYAFSTAPFFQTTLPAAISSADWLSVFRRGARNARPRAVRRNMNSPSRPRRRIEQAALTRLLVREKNRKCRRKCRARDSHSLSIVLTSARRAAR